MSDTNPTDFSDRSDLVRRQRSIGEVLEMLQPDFSDISISKIRFLESRGLITPERAPSGYRKFSPDDVERLRWILTMQRDHFLPLRVIKERLDRGQFDPAEVSLDEGSEIAVATGEPSAAPSSRFTAPEGDFLAPADLARLAGISAEQLDDLVKFGLVEPSDSSEGPRYRRDELRVAKAAGAFLARGIEARHLKAWRVAAEREAGMLEQIVTPLTHQTGADADLKARRVADELIDMGNAIREAIIIKSLRTNLGLVGE